MKGMWMVLLALTVNSYEKPEKAIDRVRGKIPINLDVLSPNLPPQIISVNFPGPYKTSIFSAIKTPEAFFTISTVYCGGIKVYDPAPILLARNVILLQPRVGLFIIHLFSYYLDREGGFEALDFIKTPDDGEFREIVPKLVNVDLLDLTQLSLLVETRIDPDRSIEIFICDVFKHFVRIGEIKYGAYTVDRRIYFVLYKSATVKYNEGGTIDVTTLLMMKNAKRIETKYEINTNATTQEEVVKKLSERQFYVATQQIPPEELGV